MREKEQSPTCEECRRNNPADFIAELCRECPRKKTHRAEKKVLFLLEKLNMMDNGCPLDRHELLNHEWRMLGILRDERQKLSIEETRNENKHIWD